MEMNASWLEAWELQMPSVAWDEKTPLEQVRGEEATGPYLLEDVDLLGLDPSCESSPVDLTALIGNMLEEEVEQPLYDLSESIVKDGELETGCSVDCAEFLQLQPDSQNIDWFVSTITATVDMSDLESMIVPHDFQTVENYASNGYEESCVDAMNVAVIDCVSAEDEANGVKKKNARKRPIQNVDTGWMTTDDECKSVKSGGAEKKSRSQAALDKESAEYRMRRDRNNKFVRASREKSRRRHQEVEENLNRVITENTELRSKVESLTREVEILRGLFLSIGAEIPRDVVNRINIATQPIGSDVR